MKTIDQIDPNFKIAESDSSDLLFWDPQEPPFHLYGLAANEKGIYCRLPVEFLPECNKGVQELAYHLAGACVRFSTDAEKMAVLWSLRSTGNMPHFAASGQSGMQLFEETDNGSFHVKNLIPAMDSGHGCRQKQFLSFSLPVGMRSYVLYLPLYNGLQEFYIGFPPRAHLEKGRTPHIEKPIVFYGSSITQGACTSKAGSCYTTLLARRLDAVQINLGFSGSGRGEISMAQYISRLSMSVFVMDYDHNAPDPAYLEATHEPFFQTIRNAQPELPIVLISRPNCELNPENTRLRYNIILRTYQNAIAAGDRHVWLIDGKTLFGDVDRDLCTVDDLHPNDLGFYRMANAIEPLLKRILLGGC